VLGSVKFLLLAFLPLLLCNCGSGGFGSTSVSGSPAILNVSSWDPKAVQRRGDQYSQHNVSAFRRNGAAALIARSAKGPLLDDKFSAFLSSADREGLLLGAYHFVTMDQDPAYQADSFVNRVTAIARSRGLSRKKILLVGDFDTKSSPDRLVRFIERVEQRTGIVPVIYLENSDALRSSLRNATPDQKRRIRRAPYWIALYGPGGTERTMGGALTPDSLMAQYGIWNSWSMWQYGGVNWANGRSTAKHYNTSSWRSPTYFGNLAHPMERSAFKGDLSALHAFWDRHSYQWW
jgi:GH25 family lysozyme M1 (1,4-beta-N-acetylmuramidase)